MVIRYGKPEEVGMSSLGIKRCEDTVKRLVDIGNTPSVVTLVARKGVIVSHKAFGGNGADLDALPLERDAIFPMCSITKVFTATCIMLLVEEGLVSLNRSVAEYIPMFIGGGKENICVHHLLTHTSGLKEEDVYKYCDKKREQGEIDIPPCESHQNKYIHESICLIQDMQVPDKAGKFMSYSSFGYGILGEIIAKVSGKPYHEFVKERIFEPLGMKDSYFIVPEHVRCRVVKRNPETSFAGQWLTSEDSLNSVSAAGGMHTTAMDLAIFGSMFLNKGTYNGQRLLSPVSVSEMTKNHIPGVPSDYRDEYFPEASWGYGWGINGTKRDGGDLFSPLAYSHWGAAGVFFCIDPVYETIQIYFSVQIDEENTLKNIYADMFNNAALAAIEK